MVYLLIILLTGCSIFSGPCSDLVGDKKEQCLKEYNRRMQELHDLRMGIRRR